MVAPSVPLPESLTRLLDEPAPRAFAATPGDRMRGEAPPAVPEGERLDGVVLRGVVLGCTGLVWIGILGLVLRRFLH